MENNAFNQLEREFFESENSSLKASQEKYSTENIVANSEKYKQQQEKQNDYRKQLRGEAATKLRAKYNLTTEQWKEFISKAF